jgi:glycosyltransferase involved in cell wall biosynthesis
VRAISFSIIIPAFNEELMLPHCLQSIKLLDYPGEYIEVIVVDNGSKDKSREIAVSYGAKVLVDTTKNVSGLRNLGAQNARGEILAFVDADCIVTTQWLNTAVKYYNAIEIAAWGSPPTIPNEATWVQKAWYAVRQRNATIEEVQWLESMNLFVRKDLFEKVGGFNETLITCEDVDFFYRIREYGKIISDDSIEVIHLGEARNIKDFIRKEKWRGKSNLHGVISHGIILREIPTLAIPAYFGVVIPLLIIVFFLTLKPVWLFLTLLLYISPTAVVMIKKKARINKGIFFQLLLLLQIYFFSRTVAVFKKS